MLPGVNSEVFPDAFMTVNALEAIGLSGAMASEKARHGALRVNWFTIGLSESN